MKKCIENGLKGKALQIFQDKILSQNIDWNNLEEKYNKIFHEEHAIPKNLFEKIKNFL
jgi:UDP-N-acetyl-alpha-D-muramoyl-L-alanyl-L-glutamate epimerase